MTSPGEAPRTFCFDLDGTLCTNTYGDYEEAEPFPWAIARVNALARAGNRIIIFTARGSSTGVDWEPTTRDQLERWSVKYDELRLGKPTADVFVDDRAYPAEAWRWGHTTVVPTPGADGAFSRAQHLGIAGAAPPHDVIALETGRTYNGVPLWVDEHVSRLLDRARRGGVELGDRRAQIRDALVAAVNPRDGALGRGDDDVVYSVSVAGDRHPAFLDLYGGPHYPVIAIGCRSLHEPMSAATAFGALVVDGCDDVGTHVVVRASFAQRSARGLWPLRAPDGGAVQDELGGAVLTVQEQRLTAPTGHGETTVIVAKVLEAAGRIGIEVNTSAASHGRSSPLAAPDELMLVNEPFCLLPIVEIDGAPLGKGRTGPVARQLLQALSAEVGFDQVGQTVRILRGCCARRAPE